MANDVSAYGSQGNIASYDSGDPTSRLSSFKAVDVREDEGRLCYLRIEGDNPASMLDDLDLKDMDVNVLNEVLGQLTGSPSNSGYTKFIISGAEDNRAEKSEIMKTCGDSFIATFTGREPHVMGFHGSLIFDYGTSSTWYHAFINAYETILRASRMAKHRCKLKLVMPDSQEIIGYLLNLNCSYDAAADSVVPIAFSMLVVDKTPSKPNNIGTFAAPEGSTQANDAKPGEGADGANDVDLTQMEELSKHIPTQAEYAEYNDLFQKASSGTTLSTEDNDRLQALTNKINNQGTYSRQYDEARTRYYSRLEEEGKLTSDQANQLLDSQERQYYTLGMKPNKTEAEQKEYDKLYNKVSADALKRSLLEKKTSGATLTQFEAIKLRQLEDATLEEYGVSSYKLITMATGQGYNPIAPTKSPAATAVNVANEKKNDPTFNKNTAKNSPNLLSEMTKGTILGTSGVKLPKIFTPEAKTEMGAGKSVEKAAVNAIFDYYDEYRKKRPDIRNAINARIEKIEALLNVTPKVTYKYNDAEYTKLRALLTQTRGLKSAYDGLYNGITYREVLKASEDYIEDNLKCLEVKLPIKDDLIVKIPLDGAGLPITNDF